MTDSLSSRREFLATVGRGAGLLAVGGLAWRLVAGRDGERVWQLDPSVCDGCTKLNQSRDGLSRCSTECVLKLSAVKAVNDFTQCGYCMICPGYHDVNSPLDEKGIPLGRVCPYDAIVRKSVGFYDADDPNNNYYQYTIDQTKCTGCGKCVIECGKPGQGNGSLRMEVRHDLCVHCNSCAIARACPAPRVPSGQGYTGAFYRDDAAGHWPGKAPIPVREKPAGASGDSTAAITAGGGCATPTAGGGCATSTGRGSDQFPCGPSPLARGLKEGHA